MVVHPSKPGLQHINCFIISAGEKKDGRRRVKESLRKSIGQDQPGQTKLPGLEYANEAVCIDFLKGIDLRVPEAERPGVPVRVFCVSRR
jgi:hypothetical protein